MRAEQDIVDAIDRYADTVQRVCSLYFRQQADKDDAFQETFLKYAQYRNDFNGEEHRKAWLIRVAANVCKDNLKRSERKNSSLEDISECDHPIGSQGDEGFKRLQNAELQEALQALDEKYRIVLYLKYYEDYTAVQIAALLGIPENTVYTNLSRGKRALKEVLEHGERS